MIYMMPKNPSRFAHFAREIFHVQELEERQAALEGIGRLKGWFSAIGSPVSLKEGGIPETDIDAIADNAHALAQVWGLKDYTKGVIVDILKLCR
jgi:alcohol dehydrogenase YqhD (iron-dependent ADH family)